MLCAFAICQPLFIGFPKRFTQSRPMKLKLSNDEYAFARCTSTAATLDAP